MGEPAFLSEEVPARGRGSGGQAAQQGAAVLTPLPAMQFQNSPEPDLEIVVCSGYGKNGALSVLQVCGGQGWRLLAGPGALADTPGVLPEEHPAPGGDNL